MDKLVVSIYSVEIPGSIIDSIALVQIDEKKPEPWIFESYFDYPVPLKEFIKLVREYANASSQIFAANFDFGKLEKVCRETPIFLDPYRVHPAEGIVVKYRDEEIYCIRMNNRYDPRTLLHELFHLCSDIPLEDKDSSSPEETSIEIAVEVSIRNDLNNLLKRITDASVKGAIDFFNIKDFDFKRFEELLNDLNLYPELKRYSDLGRKRDVNKYYFLNELKEYMKERKS